MAVSRRLRYEVLRRDNFTCRYCGATASDVKLTVDHVNPSTLGGEDKPENLVTACAACNGGKSSVPPEAGVVADVATDALRWSSAIRSAADTMLADLGRRHEVHAEFDAAWLNWGVGPEDDRKSVPRPDGWERSVDSFIAAGLPMPVLVDCIGKAMANKKLHVDAVFRYMCGIAWKKVAELQDAARKQLAVDSQPCDDGRAEGYELMYRELIGSIFGCLWGVGSEEDARVFAQLRRNALEEDEEPTVLDVDGLAAVELIHRTADLICEAHGVNERLLSDLPSEILANLRFQAAGLHDWPEELRSVDRGVLYREYMTARTAALHLNPELRVEAWTETQVSE